MSLPVPRAWAVSRVGDLHGRRIVVTGANSGIGYEAARLCARAGATVVLACRDPARGQAARLRIAADSPGASLELARLDLADLASVRAFAEVERASGRPLDVLVNNAGIMAIPRRLTTDGFETQLGTNHLGHFALTLWLFPALLRSPAPRVVTVTSWLHHLARLDLDDLMGERRYRHWGAYAQSKLANALFTLALQRKAAARGLPLLSLACHPGYAATNLQLVAPTVSGSTLGRWFMTAGNTILAQSAVAGAWPTLRAVTDPAARPGDFFGPSILELWGSPRVVDPAPLTRDEALQDRLWAESGRLTGVDNPPELAEG